MSNNDQPTKKHEGNGGDDPEAAGAWEEESPIDAAAFQTVRDYLQAIPNVSIDHPALQAALKGLDTELVKRRRDRRLQRAFGRSKGAGARGGNGKGAMDATLEDPEMILLNDDDLDEDSGPSNAIQRSVAAAAGERDGTSMDVEEEHHHDVEDDWHHVPESSPHSTDGNVVVSSSATSSTVSWTVGARLAKDVIAQIALFEIKVSTPLQAVAVALHAALRGPYLHFACTGTVEKVVPTTNGFAPPIRELPSTQFLPHHAFGGNKPPGDDAAIEWRYRKDSFGSLVLRVEAVKDMAGTSNGDEPRIRVTVIVPPAPTVVAAASTNDDDHEPQQEPPPHLEFHSGTFVNLQSFARALQASQAQAAAQNVSRPNSSFASAAATIAIPPALHYKSLPTLMAQFVRTFQLRVNHSGGSEEGSTDERVVETNDADAGSATAGASPPTQQPYGGGNRDPHPAPPVPTTGWAPPPPDPPTLDSAFPRATHPSRFPGDFDDDLNVLGGGTSPWELPSHSSPFVGGNLMGPNHPAFGGVIGGGMSGVGPNSGFGMQPRFDPYGPPGGPTDPSFPAPPGGGGPPPGQRNGPRRTGGPGDPNPDHLAPPNSFNSNNMFL